MERVTAGGRGYTRFVVFHPCNLEPTRLTCPRPPLRTYSKRSTSNGNTEPPSKKRRIDDDNKQGVDRVGSFPKSIELLNQPPKQSQPQLPLPAATLKQPKKGSILSYFKVTSPSSGTASSCEQSSEPAIPSSTPPSSPPVHNATGQRKRRRLTTKPVHQTGSGITDTAAELGTKETGLDTPPTGSEKSNAVLRDVSTNVVNRQTVRTADKSDFGKRGTKKRQKSTQATVQTTLSLSLTEKQFVECKDCSMLYNPYHEKDVKLHARQHAALKKTTKSAIGSE
jgi:hypothetical protein